MMNRISILFALAALLFACNTAVKSREVPENISAAFVRIHPNATILKWNDEPPNWEAKYKDGEERGAISFNNKAEVVETELVIPDSQLPNKMAVPDYILSHYPGEKMQRCEKVTKSNGTITYEIQITGKEIVFDAEGKYLSEELD